MQLAVGVAGPSKTQHFHLTKLHIAPHYGGGTNKLVNLIFEACSLCYQSAFSHLRVNSTFELPSSPLEKETYQSE